MPRHPPNAQKNKQNNTHNKTHVCVRKDQRCSRPLYSSQPTHPHHPHPHTRKQQNQQATREPRQWGHQGVLPQTPTACHPQPPRKPGGQGTHTHPTKSRTGTRVVPHAHSFRQAPSPAAAPQPNRETVTTTPGHPILLRKEVIQPHLPVRLPCYDLVPIANPTFDDSLPQGVRPSASGVTNFRDLTGGVYKARERIHRSVADLRLLATPTSWGRVADPNPN